MSSIRPTLARILTHLRHQYLGALAIFIALGGTSYAVATGSIGSRQIRNGSVQSKDIRNSTVRSRDVRDGTLLAQDFAPGDLPVGPAGSTGPAGSGGPPGPPGPAGPAGTAGSARAFARIGLGGLDAQRSQGVLGAVTANNIKKWCFDLPFVPTNAVATLEHPSVATDLQVSVLPDTAEAEGCPAPFRDAVAVATTASTFFYVSFN